MQDIGIQNELCDFIRGFGDNFDSLELLLHFGRHPQCSFNQAAIFHASNTRLDQMKALRYLVNNGLVVASKEHGTKLYTLTRDAQLRKLVLGLLDIDQRQWQVIAERILQDYETE